jgi:nucleoside-diphosphate-sugar epimerase
MLVTGGAGYLASTLLPLLEQENVALRVADLDFPPSPEPPGMVRVRADIRSPRFWEEHLGGVDVVFHLAAQTSAYAANADLAADLAINVMPMVHLIETCRKQQWRPFVLFSATATEFGAPKHLPVTEETPDDPLTIYDLHKLMSERYLKHAVREGILHGAALRLANVYGPGPRSRGVDRGVLNLMVRRALKGEDLVVYGDGEFLRDYVFVEDVARAFLLAAKAAEHVDGRHFVIGTGEGTTLAAAVSLVAERVRVRTGVRARVLHRDPPAGLSPIEFRSFTADSSAFTRATGWRPSCSLQEGIDRTIAACLEEARENSSGS